MRMDEITEEEPVWLEDETEILRVRNLVKWAGLEDEYQMSTNYITGTNPCTNHNTGTNLLHGRGIIK